MSRSGYYRFKLRQDHCVLFLSLLNTIPRMNGMQRLILSEEVKKKLQAALLSTIPDVVTKTVIIMVIVLR